MKSSLNEWEIKPKVEANFKGDRITPDNLAPAAYLSSNALRPLGSIFVLRPKKMAAEIYLTLCHIQFQVVAYRFHVVSP
jgi:hypothetical protein